VLGYEIAKTVQADTKMLEDFAGLDLNCDHENITILMEIFKYYGRDVNVVEAFDFFKKCHKDTKKYPEISTRAGFLKAIAELKYYGFISATKQHTFLFKKNFYGKP
jgi:CRP-like cAMP-binding protein